MDKDLHTRLEEAADRHCKCDACLLEHKATGGCWKKVCPSHSAYIAGAEYGYKEAIIDMVQYLQKDYAYNASMAVHDEAFIADFETDMNKLLEEKK